MILKVLEKSTFCGTGWIIPATKLSTYCFLEPNYDIVQGSQHENALHIALAPINRNPETPWQMYIPS